jgi:hypothetical protein
MFQRRRQQEDTNGDEIPSVSSRFGAASGTETRLPSPAVSVALCL